MWTPGSVVVPFGKYKGLTVAEIDEQHFHGRTYLRWIVTTFEDEDIDGQKKRLAAVCKQYLAEVDAQ